jgi:acetolactate synthase I/II/III large subunit
MTGAEIIVQVLADEGVDTIFGYSGGAILPTYDAIFRHNQGQSEVARRPADAADRAGQRAGRGLHGGGLRARQRQSGRVRGDLRAGRHQHRDAGARLRGRFRAHRRDLRPGAHGAIGTDAFQEAPVSNIMGAVAKHCFLVTDPTKLEATVRTAFEIARTGRPGPVVIDVPKDVQNWQGVSFGRAARSPCAAIASA